MHTRVSLSESSSEEQEDPQGGARLGPGLPHHRVQGKVHASTAVRGQRILLQEVRIARHFSDGFLLGVVSYECEVDISAFF